jgi:hypothetical protein
MSKRSPSPPSLPIDQYQPPHYVVPRGGELIRVPASDFEWVSQLVADEEMAYDIWLVDEYGFDRLYRWLQAGAPLHDNFEERGLAFGRGGLRCGVTLRQCLAERRLDTLKLLLYLGANARQTVFTSLMVATANPFFAAILASFPPHAIPRNLKQRAVALFGDGYLAEKRRQFLRKQREVAKHFLVRPYCKRVTWREKVAQVYQGLLLARRGGNQPPVAADLINRIVVESLGVSADVARF